MLPRLSLFCHPNFKLKGLKISTSVMEKGGQNGFNISSGKLAIHVVCGDWRNFLPIVLSRLRQE